MELNSNDYWEQRYARGGNSGYGSRGKLAEFKAKVINGFINENKVQSIVELGCGDGYQLLLYDTNLAYIGQDVSPTIIRKNKLKAKLNNEFYLYPHPCKAELGLSIDVLFHIINYQEYVDYLKNLFDWSTKYVIIYAFNSDMQGFAAHYLPRKFTDLITQMFTEWELDKVIKNQYPVEKYGGKGSYSDFYIYRRMI